MPLLPPTRLRQLAPLVLIGLFALGCAADPPSPAALSGNPFADRALFPTDNVRLDSAVAQARADGRTEAADVLERIDQTPSGLWLTPERYPPGAVGAEVTSVVEQAAGRTVPVFVVYGIPDRDCTGSFSAGGLSTEDYPGWLEEIAAAVGDQSVVVLEPDALPALVECGDADARLRLLSGAVDDLVRAGSVVYLDAGHSDWRSAAEMAPLLEAAGVDRVRGFATNVSNYQPLSRERAYADELADLLGAAHYVIDTSRNGDPSGSGRAVSQWCNPPGQALGTPPGYIDDGTRLDALLWIKPPAESDGTCRGGPPAGELWIQRAIALGEAAVP